MFKIKFLINIYLAFSLIGVYLVFPSSLAAQQPPDRKFLFLEDREKRIQEDQDKRNFKEKEKKIRTQQQVGKLPFDINAKSIDFDSSGERVRASGNVSIGYSSMQLEADEGSFHIPSNEAEVKGDVRISDVSGDISAERGKVNFKTGEAHLNRADIDFNQGNYRVSAESLHRSADDRFSFENTALTTCKCPEEDTCNPWQLSASRAEITKDGYGKVWNSTLDVRGVPVLYLPYLIFPAKTNRQTGLLPATFGMGRDSEFQLEMPFFWAINRSTDWTITPFVQSKTRMGFRNEIRKTFSESHRFAMGLLYSDEKERGDDLFGTDVSGLADPSVDENRIALWVDHAASFSIAGLPFQYIADGNYVSDDLTLRELELPEIGEASDRFVTSRAIVRASIFDTYSLELATEYNQAMVVDDDLVFQRLPELSVGGFSSFKPFGENPLGLKAVLRSQFAASDFYRQRDYDGRRADLYEELSFPFHFKSYFDASLDFDVRASAYDLAQRPQLLVAEDGEELTEEQIEENQTKSLFQDRSERVVPGIGGNISTVVEKVFDVEDGSLLKTVAELGRIGRVEELVRVKHSIQPVLKYRYVPEVDQDDTPIFDSIDHLDRKNVVSWQLIQRLTARYEPRDDYLYGFGAIAPDVEDLDNLRAEGPVDPALTFGANLRGEDSFQRIRRGSRLELVSFSIGQSFDIDEEQNDRTEEDALSDLNLDLTLHPNEHVRLRGRSNVDVEDGGFSSYALQAQLVDKRGDELRTELRFVEDNLRQLEMGLQVLVTDNMKLGYYGRYDDLNSEFLENKVGLRLSSSCNCWIFDVELADRINPNNTSLSFTVTLVGIGELGSRFFSLNNEEKDF